MIIELISLTLVILHKILTPTLIATSVVPLWQYLRWKSQQEVSRSQPKPKPKAKTKVRKLKPSDASEAYPNVRPETRTKFIAMCGGDMDLVSRLAGTTQGSWEKAIYDLERDRR